MKSLAVLHASQLVTVAGPKRPRVGRELSELAIIPDGGMLIRDGIIELVGPSAEIENNAGDAEVIDAHGKVVLPGFVDAHTHLIFAGNRLDDFERRARGDTYEQIAKAGAEFGQLLKRPEQRLKPIFSPKQNDTQIGSCAAERQRWSPNRATDLRSKTN